MAAAPRARAPLPRGGRDRARPRASCGGPWRLGPAGGPPASTGWRSARRRISTRRSGAATRRSSNSRAERGTGRGSPTWCAARWPGWMPRTSCSTPISCSFARWRRWPPPCGGRQQAGPCPRRATIARTPGPSATVSCRWVAPRRALCAQPPDPGELVRVAPDAVALALADEWLRCARDERLITDAPNRCGLPNHPAFRAHRHDQSIFSLRCKKRRVPPLGGPFHVAAMRPVALLRACMWRPFDVGLHAHAAKAAVAMRGLRKPAPRAVRVGHGRDRVRAAVERWWAG